ncbi:MAG: hypothetical protein KGL39_16440 [Patescibacteria group bacterium]|nr:hypothetical protein [Patescibacteria group bacterium]
MDKVDEEIRSIHPTQLIGKVFWTGRTYFERVVDFKNGQIITIDSQGSSNQVLPHWFYEQFSCEIQTLLVARLISKG